MSLSELTTASAWIAGLAIVALIAAGWRKPARATVDPTREGRRSRAARERAALELEETSTDLAGGLKRVDFAATPRMSPYLLFLSIGAIAASLAAADR